MKNYAHIVNDWLAKVPVLDGLRFELVSFVSEFWPHDLGKDGLPPEDLINKRELQILAWVVAVNEAIKSRVETIGYVHRKDRIHAREDAWLVSGNFESLYVTIPELSSRSISRLKSICRELSEEISTPLVNGILYRAYGRAIQILTPRIEEMRQGEEQRAKELETPYEPSPALVRISGVRLDLIHARERIAAGAASGQFYAGAINQKLGRLVPVKGAGNSWCPGDYEGVTSLIEEFGFNRDQVEDPREPASNILGGMQ
jgi:hypothetical protein